MDTPCGPMLYFFMEHHSQICKQPGLPSGRGT